MAATSEDIKPVAGAQAPAAAAAPTAEGLPDEVLALPFMAALLEGKPAAVYVQNDAPPPETEVIMRNHDALAEAGFRIYQSPKSPVTVFFNAAVLPGEDVKAADDAGKLDEVAVPFEELSEAFAGLKGQAAAEAPAEGAAPAAAPAAVTPAPKDPKLQQARLRNLQPGAPTSGPSPGQGRLINNIEKAAI